MAQDAGDHRAQHLGQRRAQAAGQDQQQKAQHRAGQQKAKAARGNLSDKLEDQDDGKRGNHAGQISSVFLVVNP